MNQLINTHSHSLTVLPLTVDIIMYYNQFNRQWQDADRLPQSHQRPQAGWLSLFGLPHTPTKYGKK